MHTVSVWTMNRNDNKLAGPFEEPGIVIGYDEPMLRVVPQVQGSGYGITIMDMRGRVILVVDKTIWKPGVLSSSRKARIVLNPNKLKELQCPGSVKQTRRRSKR